MRSPLRTLAGLVALTLLLAACSGNVFELAVGDCFDDGDMALGELEEIGEFPLVDCSVPHDNEVYAVVTVDGEVFPGEEPSRPRRTRSASTPSIPSLASTTRAPLSTSDG